MCHKRAYEDGEWADVDYGYDDGQYDEELYTQPPADM